MKRFLLFFVVVFVFFALVFGTDSRISSLGVPAWMVGSDDSLITLYPGQIVSNKGIIAFNSNSSLTMTMDSIEMFDLIFFIVNGGSPNPALIKKFTTPESGYITLGLDAMVLGVYALPYKGSLLYKPSNMYLEGLVSNTPHTVLCPSRVYGILFGLGLDDISIGAKLGIADQSSSFKYKEENTGSYVFDEISNSSMVINLGLGASMAVVDLGVNVSLPMIDNKGTISYFDDSTDNTTVYMNETVKTDSGFDLEVNARVNLLPIIIGGEFAMYGIKISDVEQEDDSWPYDGDFTDPVDDNMKEICGRNIMQIKGGVAANLSIASDKLTLIPGLLVKYISMNQTNEYFDINLSSSVYNSKEIKLTIMSLALNLAAEGKITDVLVARVGVSKNLFSNMKMEMLQKIFNGTILDPVPKIMPELAYIDSINLSGGVSINVGAATVEATVTGGINVENIPFTDIGSLNMKIPGSIASQISAKYAF